MGWAKGIVMWIGLGLISMVFFGVHDLCKKRALMDNAVLPVLFISQLASCLVLLMLVSGSVIFPGSGLSAFALVTLPVGEHFWLLSKTLLVGLTWFCAYVAVKHLPLSIAMPIRASTPVWTVVGAVWFFQESPSVLQWVGMGLIFACYGAFCFVGRGEGIRFDRNGWVGLMVMSTLLGALSMLFDKFLMHSEESSRCRCWFGICYIC